MNLVQREDELEVYRYERKRMSKGVRRCWRNTRRRRTSERTSGGERWRTKERAGGERDRWIVQICLQTFTFQPSAITTLPSPESKMNLFTYLPFPFSFPPPPLYEPTPSNEERDLERPEEFRSEWTKPRFPSRVSGIAISIHQYSKRIDNKRERKKMRKKRWWRHTYHNRDLTLC